MALSGNSVAPVGARDIPGYFRFLVLTCLVTATETGAGATRNFRIRLGELLGQSEPLNGVLGVNERWKALKRWADRRRTEGEPIRRIDLPNYGNMNRIGYAVKLAFPSWNDRRILTRILRRLGSETRNSPLRLIQELSRPLPENALPDGVGAAFRDFATSYRAGNRLLQGHRFWRLVVSIGDRLDASEGTPAATKWILRGQFGGFEEDDLQLTLLKGRNRDHSEKIWVGSVYELERKSPLASNFPPQLKTAIRKGILVLAEAPGASWEMDGVSVKRDHSYIIIATAEQQLKLSGLSVSWRPLGTRWLVSNQVSGEAAMAYSQLLGVTVERTDGLHSLVFEGGVRTGRTSWLGRPAFLPEVVASEKSKISVETVGDSKGSLTASGSAPRWRLSCDAAIAGSWRVVAKEGADEAEALLNLEANAPERWEFPLPPSLEEDLELRVSEDVPETGLVDVNSLPAEPAAALDDITEAVYAGGKNGWPEAELVPLLKQALPNEHLVWDILRSYAEASILQPMLSPKWRARTWHLIPPRICTLSKNAAFIEGAVGATARKRLIEQVALLGGSVQIVGPKAGVLAPPIQVVSGIDLVRLGEAMSWPLTLRTFPAISKVPSCWPLEKRSENGRTVASSWCFQRGLFLAPDYKFRDTSQFSVQLDRLMREDMDDRDVFRVSGVGPVFLSSSRTAAILEAYRRIKRPVYKWSNGFLSRNTLNGHLPLPIARGLRQKSLIASGPQLTDGGGWSYIYGCDLKNAKSLAGFFGAAVDVPNLKPVTPGILSKVITPRRRGLRVSWYELQNTGIEGQ